MTGASKKKRKGRSNEPENREGRATEENLFNKAKEYKKAMPYGNNPSGEAKRVTVFNNPKELNNYLIKANKTLMLSFINKECNFCNRTTATNTMVGVGMSSTVSMSILNKRNLELMMRESLSKRYSTNRDFYNVKIINDLIYNENTHMVSVFKDYLILDDINEFLKRFYTCDETSTRLPRLCEFFDKYSQVFPNYIILNEKRYMFKNIQRK